VGGRGEGRLTSNSSLLHDCESILVNAGEAQLLAGSSDGDPALQHIAEGAVDRRSGDAVQPPDLPGGLLVVPLHCQGG